MSPRPGEVTLFESPLFASFIELANDGFEFALDTDGIVQVRPIERLPQGTRALMRQYPHELRRLVSIITDDGVTARRNRFQTQLADMAVPGVPAFLFMDVPYAQGSCFSCGDPLAGPVFGRCWRCSLAWRLVRGVGLSTDLADTIDAAKVLS